MKHPAAIIAGTIASPSSPSVRLTAFEAPVTTKMPRGRKAQPSGISTPLKKGTAKPVASGIRVMIITPSTAAPAMMTSPNSRHLPETPRCERLASLR